MPKKKMHVCKPIIVHGREYWLTRSEIQKELGASKREADMIWKSVKRKRKCTCERAK